MVLIAEKIASKHKLSRHPYWGAYRTVLAAFGFEVSEAMAYGLGGGIGFLYLKTTGPLLVPFGGFDPMDDLVLTLGAWINRRYSLSARSAVEEMASYLRREKMPVIVAVQPEPGDTAGVDWHELAQHPGMPPHVYWVVTDIVGDEVFYYRHDDQELKKTSVAELCDRMTGLEKKWTDIVTCGAALGATERTKLAIRRAVHRMKYGWQKESGGLQALAEWKGDLEASPETFAAFGRTKALSDLLGGGMGRGLYADFLTEAEALVDGDLSEAIQGYRKLHEWWTQAEEALLNGQIPHELLERVSLEESRTLRVLDEATDVWSF
jgi:hypothetical protein